MKKLTKNQIMELNRIGKIAWQGNIPYDIGRFTTDNNSLFVSNDNCTNILVGKLL